MNKKTTWLAALLLVGGLLFATSAQAFFGGWSPARWFNGPGWGNDYYYPYYGVPYYGVPYYGVPYPGYGYPYSGWAAYPYYPYARPAAPAKSAAQ